jgi:hypothetical protein
MGNNSMVLFNLLKASFQAVRQWKIFACQRWIEPNESQRWVEKLQSYKNYWKSDLPCMMWWCTFELSLFVTEQITSFIGYHFIKKNFDEVIFEVEEINQKK